MLVYLDADSKDRGNVDIAVYPNSGIIGIWSEGIHQLFRQQDAVDYYNEED